MDSIIFKSAREILALIQSQEISCEEVSKQFLAQIKAYNPIINAISDLRDPEDIIKEARQKDQAIKEGKTLGDLHGLPITVKDTFNVKGLISSNGNPQLKSNIAVDDAELVIRLKEAGAIIIGKSNLALFALDWQSTNKWFGQTNNPYNLEYVVGGSSGGSAAALAAGFTPLELGADAGGSIRVPAHFCGICGLRTTESALPMRGSMVTPNFLRIGRYLTCNGPMAKNVDDLILMLGVLSNTKQVLAENPPIDLKQYSYAAGENIRIAYSETLENVELDKEYQMIYMDFISKLKNTNYLKVTEKKPSYNSSKLVNLWGKIAGFDFGVALNKMPFKGLITSLFIRFKYKDKEWGKGMGQGAGITPRKYAEALEQKDDIADVFTQFFQDFDIWITPVSADKAFKHQKPGVPLTINGKKMPYTKAFVPFNFPTTIPGHPILVIPIGYTSSGLPVGVQIHAQKWHDHRLLEIGKELEKLTPTFHIPSILFKE